MPQSPLVAFNGQKLGTTSYVAAQYGKQRELWTGLRHGKYYAGSYGGLSGFAANQTGATTSVGLATTYVGLCVSNPAGSTVNLVIQKVAAAITVAPAAAIGVGLIGGYAAGGVTVHTTPLTVYNNMIGTAVTAFQGLADAAATIVGTPIWVDWMETIPTTTIGFSAFAKDIDGEIILPPGAYLAIGTTAATGTSGLFGKISWEEVPV